MNILSSMILEADSIASPTHLQTVNDKINFWQVF